MGGAEDSALQKDYQKQKTETCNTTAVDLGARQADAALAVYNTHRARAVSEESTKIY